METIIILHWVSVAIYGLGAVVYIGGLISKKEGLFTLGMVLAGIGIIPNALIVAMRWIKGGVPPFIDVSESITSAVMIGVIIFLIASASIKKIKLMGVLVMPTSFILMGWAGTLIKDITTELPPSLQSYWLWVHIFSAAVGYGATLIAAGIGLLFVLKEKYKTGLAEKLPELGTLDNLGYRYITGGFIMLGVMLVSGAFWSNQVHGKYWNWDPVEVWSLICWLIYGIYLHLRITFGWRGKRLAWYALLAFPIMIVSLWGIPFVFETFHLGFRIEH